MYNFWCDSIGLLPFLDFSFKLYKGRDSGAGQVLFDVLGHSINAGVIVGAIVVDGDDDVNDFPRQFRLLIGTFGFKCIYGDETMRAIRRMVTRHGNSDASGCAGANSASEGHSGRWSTRKTTRRGAMLVAIPFRIDFFGAFGLSAKFLDRRRVWLAGGARA